MECFIVSKSTNKYLDVEHSAMKCGAKVVVSNFHGGPSQKWRIQANKIFSVNSNHALDIKWGESSGRSILQWNSHGGSNQKWNICNDQTIRSPKGLCLQVQGEYVYSSEYNGSDDQKWEIVECSKPSTITVNVIQVLRNTDIQARIEYH